MSMNLGTAYYKPIVVIVALAVLVVFYLNRVVEHTELEAIQGSIDKDPVRILSIGDPFAFSLQRNRPFLIEGGTPHFDLTILPYVATFNRIRMNSRDWSSNYHWVSFDVVWLEQLVAESALSPITADDFSSMGLSETAFTEFSLQLNRSGDELLGLPIQPHTELLWYRKDLLEGSGTAIPTTPAELIEVARRLQDPARNLYGVAWNAHRGQALGQTVAHLLGAFGAPLGQPDGSVRLDHEAALQVAHFLRELMTVSPPDILTMAWDQRVERFARGHAVFVYGWTARTPMVEADPLSAVQGKVGYAFPPMAPGVEMNLPIGQWSLGLPANLSAVERKRSLQWMGSVFSASQVQCWVQAGFGSLLLSDFNMDPLSVEENSDIELNELLRNIASAGYLNQDIRPSTPHWQSIAEMLGTVFHDLLRGDVSPGDAILRAHIALDEINGKTGALP